MNYIQRYNQLNIGNCNLNEIVGDPYQNQEKKLYIFCNQENIPIKILNECDCQIYPQLYKFIIRDERLLLIPNDLVKSQAESHYLSTCNNEVRFWLDSNLV